MVGKWEIKFSIICFMFIILKPSKSKSRPYTKEVPIFGKEPFCSLTITYKTGGKDLIVFYFQEIHP